MTDITHQHAQTLRDEWLDAYGHLNEAYYLVAFNIASWHIGETLGVANSYFTRTGCAFYTVESHLRYLRDVRAPAELVIELLILECDEKRYRDAMILRVDGTERATFETVGIHVDSRSGRVTPMPPDIRSIFESQKVAVMPEWAGRGISLNRRRGRIDRRHSRTK